MSAFKQNIRNHLSKWLDDVAAEVLNNNIQENVIATYIHYVDRHTLNKKINILKKKNEYFELKKKFKAAVKDILSKQLKISDVAKQHNIDEQELYKEYEKFNQSKSSYQYDKVTSDNGVFTFIDEFSLLQDLHLWKTNVRNSCLCCICAMKYLFYWAYTFTFTNKKKYPPTWNIYKQADEKWLYELEMRHSKEILKFFSFVCIKDMLQTTTDTLQPIENISKPSTSNTYQAPGQKKFHPSEIYDIHTKFDIRQRIRNFLYLKKRYGKVIIEVLCGKNDLEIIAQKYGIYEECRILHTIINILLDRQEYFNEKDIFKNAINVVLSGQTIRDTVQIFKKILNIHQVNVDSLTEEYNKYMQLTVMKEEYEYDRNINVKYKENCEYDRNITFINEYSLLDNLRQEMSESSCFCQICALEYFFNTSYNSILDIEKESPLWNKHGKAYENWMYEFEIRHSEIISKLEPDCKKDIPIIFLWTSASQIFSSLFDKKKSSSISGTHLQEDFDPLQFFDIYIMSDVRKKIRKYLNLSNRLEEAAEKVLNKEIDVETVRKEYGFNSKKDRDILDEKIYILKDRKEYLALKNKIDKAINKILNYRKKKNTMESLLMAARTYNITYEILEREFDKFCQLKVTYKFDQTVLKHGVFTFVEEFSLLEKLHLWKTTTQDCTCQVCALECVLKLAYIFANISMKEFLPWENKIEREKWICEFQMRHSKEISKFSNYSNCRKVKLLTSKKIAHRNHLLN